MKGDFTRDTFLPLAHRRTVRYHQGRIPLDAELNETQDILISRVETGTVDIIGPDGAPVANAGFGIEIGPANEIIIKAGRYYVQGILCELKEDILLTAQIDAPGLDQPEDPGLYLAYLDVWFEHITALEDPDLQEVALHGVETATRQRIVAQVKLLQIATDPAATIECDDVIPEWDALIEPPTGLVAARAQPEELPANACSMTPGAGYRRLENQLYRIEIHDAGDADTATYKWSRENGHIATPWIEKNGNELTVGEQGRDPNRLFRPGGWVELIDRERELSGIPGTLVQLTNVHNNILTIDPATATGPVSLASFGTLPRVRRWESAGALPLNDDPDSDGYSPLEYGVQSRFEDGTYHVGDYWMIPARTATGDIDWPRDEATDEPIALPRSGIHHHYARLAILSHENDEWTVVKDCRKKFPTLAQTSCCCRLYVGDGEKSHGHFNTFDDALQNLPAAGGVICFLPGQHRVSAYIENRHNIIIKGCGRDSVIVPESDKISPAVFAVMDGGNIEFQNLTIEHESGYGIYVGANAWLGSANLRILNCEITSGLGPIIVEHWERVRIENCTCRMNNTVMGGAGITIAAIKAEVRHNCVQVANQPGASVNARSWGGIHVLGGSSSIRIRENTIAGGDGHGISLGGRLLQPSQDPTDDAETESDVTLVVASELVAVRTVAEDGSVLANQPVYFISIEDAGSYVSDESGLILIDLGPGEYRVFPGNGYSASEIRSIDTAEGISIEIVLSATAELDLPGTSMASHLGHGSASGNPSPRDATDPRNARLPIIDIAIVNNAITDCGLSGIGVIPDIWGHGETNATTGAPTNTLSAGSFSGGSLFTAFGAFFPKIPSLFAGPISRLRIEDNTIEGVYTQTLPKHPMLDQFGFGGITLGSVSSLTIRNNRILDFGDAREKAVCGLFILHADGLDIFENEIRGAKLRVDRAVPQGFSGGIICRLAMDRLYSGHGTNEKDPALGAPMSVRICSNIIESAIGRPLTLFGFGDMRIEGNRCDANQTAGTLFDLIAANTLIINLGGLFDFVRLLAAGQSGASGIGSYNAIMTGSTNENTIHSLASNTPIDTSDPAAHTAFDPTRGGALAGLQSLALFGARTHLAHNRFLIGARNVAPFGHLIFSFGDVGFSNNQSVSYQQHILPFHGALAASSVRAAENRISESHMLSAVSLLTAAFGPNNSVHNQSDHCVIAISAGRAAQTVVDFGNQILFANPCSAIRKELRAYTISHLAQAFAAALHQRDEEVNAASAARTIEPQIKSIVENERVAAYEHSANNLKASFIALNAARNNALDARMKRYGDAIERVDSVESLPLIDRRAIEAVDRSRHMVAAAGQTIDTQPDASEAVMVGSVVLENQRGIEGMTVEIVSSDSGTPLGKTKTGAGGLFRLNLNEDALRKLEDSDDGRIRMIVRDASGTAVHEIDQPAILRRETTTVSNLVVSRETMAKRIGVAAPALKPTEKRSNRDTIRGTGRDNPAIKERPEPTRKPTSPADSPTPVTRPSPDKDVPTQPAEKRPNPTNREKQPATPSTPEPSTRRVDPARPISRDLSDDPTAPEVKRATPKHALTDVPGVGATRARKLERSGIHDVDTLIATDTEKLQLLLGRGVNAGELKQNAINLRAKPDRPR